MLVVRVGMHKRYTGRFNAKATKLVKSGTRVGMIWASKEKEVHCHVCNKDFLRPKLDPVHKDVFTEAPTARHPSSSRRRWRKSPQT